MTVAHDQVRQRIEGCQGLVRSLATSVHRRTPSNVELDDLVAYGQIGLAEAARDFDPDRGSRFSTYAYYRIRGAIYDGLSKMTWFSRAQYRQIRYDQMAEETLRADSDAEAHATGQATVEDDARWLRNMSRALAVVYLSTHRDGEDDSAEDRLVDSSAPTPSAETIGKELTEKLHELIDALPPEAATLIRATYFEGLTLQEAGKRLGVSKSWASRLHAKTLQQLARSLRMGGLTP